MSSQQDEISIKHDGSPDNSLLVFFITGNPGLVGYYQTFLTLIFDSLRSKHSSRSIHVYGTSLAGFGIDFIDGKGVHAGEDGPWDLEQQIQYVDRALTSQVSSQSARVVLIGHSVGSYILLEVLRRQKSISSHPKFISGVCLFPTVTHIALSPSGKKFTLLSSIPYFPVVIGFLAAALFSWVSTPLLEKLVGKVTGQPVEAARVTTAFLQRKGAVRQALYLAQHEMKTITADRWDDELWGVSKGAASDEAMEQTKLFFLFGTGDHWVADETRDELIAVRRGKEDTGPSMEIDETGIPHGFCIKHNGPVATKVVDYINEAVREKW